MTEFDQFDKIGTGTYIKEDKEIKFIASIICALSSLIAILVLQYKHKLLKSLEYLLTIKSRIKK